MRVLRAMHLIVAPDEGGRDISFHRVSLNSSKLCVQTSRKDRNRSPVGIVSGIVDELIVEGERRPFVEAVGIIGLEDLLGAIVELAIADQNPQATSSEICTRYGRESFDHPRHANLVIRSPPRIAL